MAESAHIIVKIVPEEPVAGHDLEFAVLYADVAGRFLEKLLVAVACKAQFFLQPFHFRDIGGNFQHQLYFAVVVQNGCRVHDNGHVVAVLVADELLAALAFACFQHLAYGTGFVTRAFAIGIHVPAACTYA